MAQAIALMAVEMLEKLLKERGLTTDEVRVFGSWSRGDDTVSSDIDIAVVSSDFEGKDLFERVRLTRGIHRELVQAFDRPFDLLLLSPSEWKIRRWMLVGA